MARKSKVEKPVEEPEETFAEKPTTEETIRNLRKEVEEPKQKGIVRLITKNRIIIVYGEELGASIDYDPTIHFNLKVGDEIEF